MKKNQIPSMETEKKEAPIYRTIEKKDFEGVIELMKEIRPHIGGSQNPALYYALCCEALIDKRVVFVVGEEQSKIIAFFLAIIDPNHWRLSFMFRHPLLGIDRVLNISFDRLMRLLNKAKKKTKDFNPSLQNIDKYITPMPSNKSWKDSAPDIAKVVFDAVAEIHRGRHIAKNMREYMLEVLAKRGAKRADGDIHFHNIPSIHVWYGLGFNIHNMGDQLFITKDLQPEE